MIIPLNPTQAIIDDSGHMTQQMRDWAQQVSSESLIVGSGTPEGVIAANQGREYMDQDGALGSVKFIKQKAAIGGDSKLGWVVIG